MDIEVKFGPHLSGATEDQQQKVMDEEIDRFSAFMADKVSDPLAMGRLTNFERAILKTYLVYKVRGKDQR